MKAGFTAFYHNALHLTGMHCATKYARGLQGTASVREGFPVVYMNFSLIRKVTSSFCFHLLHHAIMHDSVSHSMSLSFQDFLSLNRLQVASFTSFLQIILISEL